MGMTTQLRSALLILCITAGISVLAEPPRFNEISGPAANADAMESAKPVTEPMPSAEAAIPVAVPGATRTVEESQPPRRWSVFSTQKYETPKETTNKPNDALVPTKDTHPGAPGVLQQGGVQYFEPGYTGQWEVKSSRMLCTLLQKIPQHGRVEFRQGVGQPLDFVLYVDNPPAGTGMAHLRSEPPLWTHYTKATDLGIIEIESGENAVTASSEWARHMMTDLGQGMQPTLQYWDSADAQNDIKVTLSAHTFKMGLDNFNVCRSQLLRYEFDKVHITVLNFNTDSSKILKPTYKQLNEVVEILQTDAGIKLIEVEIYTPTKELVQYNFRLATRRAQAVRDYLIQMGIDEEKLKIKIHTQKKSKLEELGVKPDQVQIVLHRGTKKKGG
jgi:outer membrane protein OmpA-like peptidoglycan-associated protein